HTTCYRDWSSDVCSSDLPHGYKRLVEKYFEKILLKLAYPLFHGRHAISLSRMKRRVTWAGSSQSTSPRGACSRGGSRGSSPAPRSEERRGGEVCRSHAGG